jgi:predicted phosphodiesterase
MNAHISNDLFCWIVDPSVENPQTLFKDNNEDLICFGHHHPIQFFRGDKSVYLNPGSLGCNHKPNAPYALVTVSNEKFKINLEETTYDNSSFLESYH